MGTQLIGPQTPEILSWRCPRNVNFAMNSTHLDIVLDGNDIGPEFVARSFGHPIRLRISSPVLDEVARNRNQLERHISHDRLFYGINTGFGSLCDRKISPAQLEKLQENLLMSHAVGVGPPVPEVIVRLMLLFKIAALSRGHSGIRAETLETLAKLLHADLLPVVPCKGSLGASGDLAPLSHLALPLIGLGKIQNNGKTHPAKDALASHGIETVTLGAKEGLALINGTQFMTAYGAVLCLKARRLCRISDVLAAMSLEAVRGSAEPFDPRIHALRPHPGAIKVAENIRNLLAHRPAAPARPYGQRVQDPYSLRCVPAVHGATRDAVDHVEEVIYREINSVTDNPLVFEDAILSGGNFHGQAVALGLDYLAMATAELGSISERRQYLLVNDSHYGLPVGLIAESGINSGLMIAHYTSAALVAENKVFSHPASVDSIPTSGGQEDHVSMGATSALKCWDIVNNVERVLGIELLIAAQALEFTPVTDLAPLIRQVRDRVREKIPAADSDRLFGEDIEAAIKLVQSHAIEEYAESAIGPL